MSQPNDSGVPEEFVPPELSEVSDRSVLNDVLALPPGPRTDQRAPRPSWSRGGQPLNTETGNANISAFAV